MTIEINLSHILALASLLLGGAWALIKITVSQFSKNIDEKFDGVEQIRKEATQHWDVRYGKTEFLVGDLAHRLVRLETEMKHVPTQQSFNTLIEAVAGVRGQNATHHELLQRMERQMNLINEWMMENK